MEGKYKENNHFRKCPLTFIHHSLVKSKKNLLFLNLKKLKVFKSTVHKRRSEIKENTCQRKVWSKKSDDWCVGSQYWEESSQQVLAKVLPKTFPKEKGTEREREDENFGCYLYRRRCQMFQKVEYGLPAKIWRFVGCTKMISW